MKDKQPGALRVKNEKELKRFMKATGEESSADITTSPKRKLSDFRKLEIRVDKLENESKVVAAQMRKVFGEHWMEEYKNAGKEKNES